MLHFFPSTRKISRNVDVTLGTRVDFQSYSDHGGDQDYQSTQFQNGFTAIRIAGKIHERVHAHFRNRFNKGTDIPTLDNLGSHIERASIDVQISPRVKLQLGKQDAYYGGYEYSFSAMDVLKYNGIHNSTLAYVTGVGVNYQFNKDHDFGVQMLNSRTTHYDDLYGDIAAGNIKEPDWPV